MAEKPTFGYWGVRGRGASIRLLLAHLSVDYENIAYSDPEVWFGTDKPALQTAFPNLPYWKDGDVVMSETLAILAQICRKYKPDYLGRTLKEQAETSMVMGAADAAQMKFAKVLFGEGDFEAGKAAQVEGLKDFATKFAAFKGTNKFAVGSEPTYVDFFLVDFLLVAKIFDESIVSENNLGQYLEDGKAMENVLAHYQANVDQPGFPESAKWSYTIGQAL